MSSAQILKERALTLFSTGKFATRKLAMKAAENEKIRQELKKQPKVDQNDATKYYYGGWTTFRL
jgi:hypothetical protein